MKKIIIPKRFYEIIDKILITSIEYYFDSYIVGGFIRDLIIGRDTNDLDILICSKKRNILDAINFTNIFVKKYRIKKFVSFYNFGTSKIYINEHEVEFIAPRKEKYNNVNSRNPIVSSASLKEDTFRRDFTINSLFLRLQDMKIFDLTRYGLKDINNKIIRLISCTNLEKKFTQDPLRILRAIRQSVQLGFYIEQRTYNAMKIAVKRIKIVPINHIRDELNKILIENTTIKAIKIMGNIKLLSQIFPEFEDFDNSTKILVYRNINGSFKYLPKTKNKNINKKNIILKIAILQYFLKKINNNYKLITVLKRFKYSRKTINKITLVESNFNRISSYMANIKLQTSINKNNKFHLIVQILKKFLF
ncbi:MAG: hypothetical protein LBL53_00630 [Endomicrobium sp.]|jgi:tRNA nucleotidyltransferase/poly(A) polymerase|nr:hypothetical protein [Endomicrobium sp.]